MSAFEDLQHLKTFDKIMRRIKNVGGNPNPKEWKWLGAGAYGNAYDVGNGLVVKVTRSTNEVAYAKKLKGKKFKHLYKVIDAFASKNKHSQSNCVFYDCYKVGCKAHTYAYEVFTGFIITPKYYKLTKYERASLNKALDWYYPTGNVKTLNDIKRELSPCSEWSEATILKRLKKIQHFNLDKMAFEMQKLKLGEGDVHSGNILKKKDGSFVLIDLTC